MKSEKVYFEIQSDHMNNDVFIKSREDIHSSWFNEKTVDFWRHKRMYNTAAPIGEFYKSKKWLTVGDGRYGLDSVRLKKLFSLADILPSDISRNMLEIGREKGLFDSYSIENAEALSFNDNFFDVIFCKEAYHHFPRAILALYEMIRVSRSVVVLIEPVEYPTYSINKRDYFFSLFKLIYTIVTRRFIVPKIVNINPVSHGFEESGNYIYSVSLREIERIVHGIDLGGMAWLGFNDYYQSGCEFAEASEGNPIFENTMAKIASMDKKCRENPEYYKYEFACVVIFKNTIDPKLKESMKKSGFKFIDKVDNPFFKS